MNVSSWKLKSQNAPISPSANDSHLPFTTPTYNVRDFLVGIDCIVAFGLSMQENRGINNFHFQSL